MPTAYIHIGSSKTGSSAIQAYLYGNRRALAARGYRYIAAGRAGDAHFRLASAYGAPVSFPWRGRNEPELVRRAFRRELARAKGDVVISCEVLELLEPGQIAEFLSEMRGGFELRVILYLRRPDRLCESLYNQHVKLGQTRLSFPDYVLERGAARFDLLALVERWSEAAGADRLTILPYERSQMPEGSVGSFLGALGIGDRSGLRPIAGEANPSLTPLGLGIARGLDETRKQARHRFFGLFDPEAPEDRRLVTTRGAPPLFTPEERLAFLARFDEGNARIAREWLGRADGRLFRDPVETPPAATIPETIPVAAAAAIASAGPIAAEERRQSTLRKWRLRSLIGLVFGLVAGTLLGLSLGLML